VGHAVWKLDPRKGTDITASTLYPGTGPKVTRADRLGRLVSDVIKADNIWNQRTVNVGTVAKGRYFIIMLRAEGRIHSVCIVL
jgi:hypothetical protein